MSSSSKFFFIAFLCLCGVALFGVIVKLLFFSNSSNHPASTAETQDQLPTTGNSVPIQAVQSESNRDQHIESNSSTTANLIAEPVKRDITPFTDEEKKILLTQGADDGESVEHILLSTPPFNIIYFADTERIVVAINDMPTLSQKEAETFLSKLLNQSPERLCALNIVVPVLSTATTAYKPDIGLSACPR